MPPPVGVQGHRLSAIRLTFDDLEEAVSGCDQTEFCYVTESSPACMTWQAPRPYRSHSTQLGSRFIQYAQAAAGPGVQSANPSPQLVGRPTEVESRRLARKLRGYRRDGFVLGSLNSGAGG